ncbi:hypothetical protein ACUXHY_000773 [Cytobacillus horneckiae]
MFTIPFTALQFIDIEPYESISFRKRQAIRELQNSFCENWDRIQTTFLGEFQSRKRNN